MAVTFDQWLDIICRTTGPEDGFGIQGDVHASASLIFEWKEGNLTNAQIREALNFTNDPELGTVATHIGGLTRAQTLALQDAMILAALGIAVTGVTYDKALLRTRFGL